MLLELVDDNEHPNVQATLLAKLIETFNTGYFKLSDDLAIPADRIKQIHVEPVQKETSPAPSAC